MLDVYENREKASKKAQKAKAYMLSHHSVEATGQRYKKLLEELNEKL